MGINFQILSSLEGIPLIRKFAIIFFLTSILPCAVILYLLQHYLEHTAIDEYTLLIVLCSMGLGTVVGFYSMRKSIVKIHKITSEATKTISKNIPSLSNVKTSDSEITQLVRTFNEITVNLQSNIRRLEASKRTMQYVLSKLAVGMSSLHSIDTFLDLIVEITANALDAETGCLMLLDEQKQELYVRAASGFKEELKSIRLRVDEGIPGWVVQNKKPLLAPQLTKTEKLQREPFMPPLLCAPMLYQDRIIGVLIVAGKMTNVNFEEDELLIVSNLASQTAVAVENDRLHLDAEKTYLGTITALAMAVEARDPYSRGHSDRVSQYSVKVAEKLGLSSELIQDIKTAAELHDVGKIGISDDVLKKAERLNDEEWQIMRKHPIIGEGIVKPVYTLVKVCNVIRHHHEWLDGTGYPDRLKADQIPLGAKILAVADSFDAMTTDRPYRKGMSIEVAKEELKRYIDIRYDRGVVEAFLSVV